MAPRNTREYIPLGAINSTTDETVNGSEEEQPGRAQSSSWHRLGTTSILIVFIGCPSILLAVTLLAIFWYYSVQAIAGQEPAVYWLYIINASWATRLVTLCTTAIRAVVTLQVGLTAAMVAAIVLETEGVPLLLGPFYSMLRAFKVAPVNIWTATNLQPCLPRFSLCACTHRGSIGCSIPVSVHHLPV